MNLVPEANKHPGVYYAFTSDGIELPIVDVSHPAFALDVSEAEQHALIEKFMHEDTPLRQLPKPLRNLALRFFLRGSILARGIRQAEGTFMAGMQTYLLKIGPKMLGAAYSKPIDRRIAAALPTLGVRLRLQDMAYLMADALSGALVSDHRRPIHLLNIAGGPASDSLNALILLAKKEGSPLAERCVVIEVLDLDDHGPEFGKAALAALSEEGAPLHGIHVDFRHTRYNWADTSTLQAALRAAHETEAVVLCSSEGGLFEYGSDAEIEANLKVLRSSPEVLAVTGSVTRADKPTMRLRETSAAATRPRGLELFGALVRRAGWTVTRAIERPFSVQVLLTRTLQGSSDQ